MAKLPKIKPKKLTIFILLSPLFRYFHPKKRPIKANNKIKILTSKPVETIETPISSRSLITLNKYKFICMPKEKTKLNTPKNKFPIRYKNGFQFLLGASFS